MATIDTATAVPTLASSTLPPADSPLRRTLRRFLRHRLAVVGLVVIVVLVVLAVIGSEAAALKQSLVDANKPPSAAHWLGTDRNGRDVLARTLVGGRVSLLVGIVAVFFATMIGTVLGAIAGYYRRADFVIMRVVDIVMSFPTIVLLLVAVALVGPGIIQMMVMIGLLTWTHSCRILRGQFLQLRDADFVMAARVMGVRDRAIVLRHILPNSLAPLLVYASLGVASVVLLEAGLSYLGLGVQPPTPSWGNMLNDARNLTTLERLPFQWVPALVATVTFVLAVNFVGDGLRDAFDPRSTRGG
jgi:peptide/nickel transport system permease protein